MGLELKMSRKKSETTISRRNLFIFQIFSSTFRPLFSIKAKIFITKVDDEIPKLNTRPKVENIWCTFCILLIFFQMESDYDPFLEETENNATDFFNETTASNNLNETERNCGLLDENYVKIWHLFQWWCEGVLFTGIGLCGLIANCFSIGILCTRDMRKHSFNQLLIALCIFDLLFIVVSIPVYSFTVFQLFVGNQVMRFCREMPLVLMERSERSFKKCVIVRARFWGNNSHFQ